jgi:hypothetical protein
MSLNAWATVLPALLHSVTFYSIPLYSVDHDVTNHRRKNISANIFSHKEVTMQKEKSEDDKLTDAVYWTAQTWMVDY